MHNSHNCLLAIESYTYIFVALFLYLELNNAKIQCDDQTKQIADENRINRVNQMNFGFIYKPPTGVQFIQKNITQNGNRLGPINVRNIETNEKKKKNNNIMNKFK